MTSSAIRLFTVANGVGSAQKGSDEIGFRVSVSARVRVSCRVLRHQEADSSR